MTEVVIAVVGLGVIVGLGSCWVAGLFSPWLDDEVDDQMRRLKASEARWRAV